MKELTQSDLVNARINFRICTGSIASRSFLKCSYYTAELCVHLSVCSEARRAHALMAFCRPNQNGVREQEKKSFFLEKGAFFQQNCASYPCSSGSKNNHHFAWPSMKTNLSPSLKSTSRVQKVSIYYFFMLVRFFIRVCRVIFCWSNISLICVYLFFS